MLQSLSVLSVKLYSHVVYFSFRIRQQKLQKDLLEASKEPVKEPI